MDCQLLTGDALTVLKTLPDASVQCCVTSPPYWHLRDYGVPGQIGLEPALQEYLEALVNVFREVRRVLRDDGTLWINIGDTYAVAGGQGGQGKTGQRASRTYTASNLPPRVPAGLKPKDLCMVPARLAIALQEDGWYLRSEIIWHKPNPMPESVTDRPTTAHDYVFLLAKQERYYYDASAIREPQSLGTVIRFAEGKAPRRESPKIGPNGVRQFATENTILPDGRNKRTVWTIPIQAFRGAHFATMPEALVEPCIRAGTKSGDMVLDPFVGSGTVCAVAMQLRRRPIGIDLNPEYLKMAARRIWESCPEARGQSRLFEAR